MVTMRFNCWRLAYQCPGGYGTIDAISERAIPWPLSDTDWNALAEASKPNIRIPPGSLQIAPDVIIIAITPMDRNRP